MISKPFLLHENDGEIPPQAGTILVPAFPLWARPGFFKKKTRIACRWRRRGLQDDVNSRGSGSKWPTGAFASTLARSRRTHRKKNEQFR
jgi:hypothetical protein